MQSFLSFRRTLALFSSTVIAAHKQTAIMAPKELDSRRLVYSMCGLKC